MTGPRITGVAIGIGLLLTAFGDVFATTIGPSAYRSIADSPFYLSLSEPQFYLEDFSKGIELVNVAASDGGTEHYARFSTPGVRTAPSVLANFSSNIGSFDVFGYR